jgi:hypothetical protein
MKIKIQSLISATGMSDGQISIEIEKMCGKTFPSQLITNALDGVPIPALRAALLCQWLSSEFGKEIKPEDISDLKVHAFSTLPASTDAGGEESAAQRASKIEGFCAGFEHAYGARFNNQRLSNTQAQQLAEVATSKRMSIFQESVQPALSQDAFRNACAFAGNALDMMFDGPNGTKKYQEIKAMDKETRTQYARNMARHYIDVL